MEDRKINPIEEAWMKYPEAREDFINILMDRYRTLLEYVYIKSKIKRRWEYEPNDIGSGSTCVD